MLAGLTRHVHIIDFPEGMIQFQPIGFISTLNGTATLRDFTVLRWDPFHTGSDGQELVFPIMPDFGGSIRHAAWRVNGKGDLARMDGTFKDRGTNVDRAFAIYVVANG